MSNNAEQELQQIKIDILTQWQSAKAQLDYFKELEMSLRTRYVDLAFDHEKIKGTERVNLANGWQVKAVKKINFSFVKNAQNKVNNDEIMRSLQEIAQTIDGGEFIAGRLIKWEPNLSEGKYNKLPENAKNIIDRVIVTKPGSPTLELIPPKGYIA